MSILRYFRKIEFLHDLIRKKATGDRSSFARKAGMSKSMLSEYLLEMKTLGFPIRYDRNRNTYYYEYDGKMVKTLFEDQARETDINDQYDPVKNLRPVILHSHTS